MGLLDFQFPDDPQKIGLLLAAAQMFQGRAPGENYGGLLGRAMESGMKGYAQGQAMRAKLGEEAQQAQMRQMQMDQVRAAAEQQRRIEGLAGQYMKPGAPQMLPTDQETPTGPRGPGTMDWHGYA